MRRRVRIKTINISFCCAIFYFLFALTTNAQEDATRKNESTAVNDTIKRPLSELSLIELAQLKISVASKRPLTKNESPGIVSLITKEEISESGARDLIDVLRLVPGIEFGIDVRGVTSIGIRGQWAHEGKILLLWDGQIINEVLFQTLQLGNHYPVELIERIEIIRGPGSAVYGGMAEFGVINIITSPTQNVNKVTANSMLGWMAKTYGRQNFTLALSEKKQDLTFDLSLHSGIANRSDQIMSDFYSSNQYHSYDMSDQSGIRSLFINGGFNYMGFSTRLIIDRYSLNDRTLYGLNLQSAPEHSFTSYIFDAQYKYDINDNLYIISKINYIKSASWQCLDKSYPIPIYQDKYVERHMASITANYQITPKINSALGASFYIDKGFAGDSTFFRYNRNQKTLRYSNLALFAQCIYVNDIADITLGGRFERSSEAGNSFVPRLALIKTIDDFHFKALYSLAFHSPSIENIGRYSSSSITAEKTTVIEFEAGYQFAPFLSVSANVFDMTLRNPIVFGIDPVHRYTSYKNGSRSETLGFETEIRLKTKHVNSTVTYSFYQANRNEIFDYAISGNDKILLGFPQHKLTLNSTVYLTSSLTANCTAVYLSERYVDNRSTRTQYSIAPQLLVNLYLSCKDILTEGITFGVGVYDIFDARYSFIQPYKGGNAPMPGPSREIIIKFSYEHDFF
jgi:outer membrane receptor for ferrienterochelin and colicin